MLFDLVCSDFASAVCSRLCFQVRRVALWDRRARRSGKSADAHELRLCFDMYVDVSQASAAMIFVSLPLFAREASNSAMFVTWVTTKFCMVDLHGTLSSQNSI